ncbi:MAG: TIGR04283 family arsenosugar biosynthesis glycosyltransferase [Proteobacteria bacterium]|nr:TIGR04283 family arsenosugar biosynthesis glycosyltransferase [Pseudomonadota bacterium]MBU1452173.1 TIGR04283 family arsenosugar biosynthesis glycosyltransferase [Pseudomonadota bacterium]MBU2469975.1 TIGR04283 family arsenosugar biosynthesis glycosyltransferase [Pseudomonadota bacterium]MBU2518935.1 TIGR04283 family arsenosugar biosynthesis glycosyltransferase [Pseudomonadota bacterium]
MGERGPISVVIPTLDEEAGIASCVARVGDAPGVEVIVADGGSGDATVAIAKEAGARVIAAPRGRARQMNAGAATARGGILLFLHADTLLPPGWDQQVRQVLERPGAVAGAFSFRLDQRSAALRFIELAVAWRCRLAGMPYGDQGLFLRRHDFMAVGGYPDLPIMEDCELVRRLKKRGRIIVSPAPAITSARRWMRKGVISTTALNYLVVSAFYLGCPPALLRRLYDRA